jgi:signal transduction histidine kinase
MIAATIPPGAVFESSACALAVCNPDGTIRQANSLMSTWTGRAAGDLSGTSFARILAPPSALLFELQLRPRIALGQRIDGALVSVLAPDFAPRPTVLNAVQRDDGGFDVALVCVSEREAFEESLRRAHADTEAARAQLADTARALRDSEALVRAQFAATPLPTLVWRRDATRQFVLDSHNAVANQLSDAPLPVGTLDAAQAFGHATALTEVMHAALDRSEVRELELEEAPRPLGTARCLVLTLGPLPPDRVVMHARDVTRERAVEAQQRHGFKMQALGQLVAGIAHEFNNVLSVIAGNLELMRAELEDIVPSGHQLREDVDTVQDATRRAVGLVSQLLAFGGRQPVTCGVHDMNELLRASERLLRPVLGRTILWQLQLTETPTLVHADRDQLMQVITNLAINARDAVHARASGGTITISTTWQELPDDRLVLSRALQPGRYVRVAVQDTGTGMSEEVRTRAFEPFFTTKAVGHGTGLGLSTIYGIVRDLGGVAEIDSTANVGTTVWLLLPSAPPTSV